MNGVAFWNRLTVAALACVGALMRSFASPVSAEAKRLNVTEQRAHDSFLYQALAAKHKQGRQSFGLGLLRVGKHFVFTALASLRTRHSPASGYRPAI